MRTARAVGHYEADKAAAHEFPYWRYEAMDDLRTRPEHAALDGKVFHHNDPFWDTHYPPNGFNCRCMVVEMTKEEVEDEGLEVSTAKDHTRQVQQEVGTDKRTGEVITRPATEYNDGRGVSMTPDPGWNYNPGIPGSQEVDMRRMEGRLFEAQQTGREASALDITRRSIAEGVASKHYRDFVAQTKKEQGIRWPVAVMASGRATELGFGDKPRVVRLSSGSVDHERHQETWKNYTDDDWRHLQHIVNHGNLVRKPGRQRVLVADDAHGKPWKLAIKESIHGEVFVMTHHRIDPDKKWDREKKETKNE